MLFLSCVNLFSKFDVYWIPGYEFFLKILKNDTYINHRCLTWPFIVLIRSKRRNKYRYTLDCVFFEPFVWSRCLHQGLWERKKREREKRNREIFVSLFNEQNYWRVGMILHKNRRKEKEDENSFIFSLTISIFSSLPLCCFYILFYLSYV